MSASSVLEHLAPAISDALYADESRLVAALGTPLDSDQRRQALATGRALVAGARARRHERPWLDAFLQEYGLESAEGVALLCLAEALLRIPDDDTADRLIAEKIATGDWADHAGASGSFFVNASTWALMLTGGLVPPPAAAERDAAGWLRGLAHRLGESVLRQALRRAMKIIGAEFVVGRSIDEALARCGREPALALCSFDVLGEGARSDTQARRHFDAYAQAIEAVARMQPAGPGDLQARSSVSIKLSALEPRFALCQRRRVEARLVPRVLELSRLAARHELPLTLDAEEADRLEISLQIIAALARDPATRRWHGLGFAVQAYGRRAPAVIDWAIELARATDRRISIRLVKGAYWDSEIKRAQERGLGGYPVFTRKPVTDVAYLACARRLLAASDSIHAQFATHNAHTIGAILALADGTRAFEFQRLHGMDVLLYDEARRQIDGFPAVRVYAPVGPHQDLLAYLVRRLLENGANTSFVNRFLDDAVPVAQVVSDPVAELARLESLQHPGIPLPAALYGAERRNSQGVDFGVAREIEALHAAATARVDVFTADARRARAGVLRILNPADRRVLVGQILEASGGDIDAALTRAGAAWPEWNAMAATDRAAILQRAADAFEAARDPLVALLVQEAGKTLPDAVAEIRETADFCRYYAAEARRLFTAPVCLPGPTGESNQLQLTGRGVWACISPWNFPLAIFTGQVTAALAAGNAVVAKPAEATPLVARTAVSLLHAAGVPREVLALVPARGRHFGEVALGHAALAGVAFTGSTATGQWLNRRLAGREGPILPLIAETGGLNVMIVDSSALPEQVVDDALLSAFGSAGQRCSALRVLCVQEDIADRILELLAGAMAELVIGDPADPATDVGPLISPEAVTALEAHLERLRPHATLLQTGKLTAAHRHGSFFAPRLIEIDRLERLDREPFGPILHVVRYRAAALDALLAAVRSSGFGLTLGIQSRLETTWRHVYDATFGGNTYVNRSMIGAVVGVQPFGGTGLSGTGPKAGGPNYLPRFATERTLSINTAASGGNPDLLRLR